MSIPLDRLYHYIESIAQDIRKDNIVIYRFFPHGSKKLEDLTYLRLLSWDRQSVVPHIYCYDQEPLNFDLYHNTYNMPEIYKQELTSCGIALPDLNIRRGRLSIYDKCILLHSEKNSTDLEKYKNNGFIPAYYWSHAIISRDWFRYAEHITQKKTVNKLFLVYNRAWSGTREYRLGFADRLIMNGLVDHVMMRVSPIDSTIDKHYDLHHFKHPEWRPRNVIEKYFPLCEAESHYSADFEQEDYESTAIEVVLETLFDDLRTHLTEKTLRPIAMGQPFILAGTYNSLKYLRSYGFKTFADCWDESYDMMTDSVERMNKITDIMSNIISIAPFHRKEILEKAQAIADYNKQHFFSDEFQNLITEELKTNLAQALTEIEQTNTCSQFLEWRKKLSRHNKLKPHLLGETLSLTERPNPIVVTRQDVAKVVKQARQYYIRSLSPD